MNPILKYLAGLFSAQGGSKTLTGAALVILLALNDLAANLAAQHVPVHPFIPASYVGTITMFAGALGIVGLAHKQEKAKAVVQDLLQLYKTGQQTAQDGQALVFDLTGKAPPAK